MTKEHLKIELSELKPNPKNPKLHDDELIKGSIKDLGFVDDIVIDEKNIILSGHGRLKALQELGTKEVDVIRITGWTQEQKNRYLLLSNKSVEKGGWDFELLADIDKELLKQVGFESQELDKIFKDLNKDEDEVPDVPEKPTSKLGEVYQLGEHKLMCGDTTKSDDIEKLMAGEKADIIFTSPPYNIGKNAELRQGLDRNKNKKYNLYIDYWDDKDNKDWIDLIKKSIELWRPFSRYQIYDIQMLAGNKIAFFELLDRLKEYIADVMIWDKNHGAPCPAKNVMTCQFKFIIFFSSEEKPNRSIKTASFQGNLSNVYRGEPQRNNEFANIHGATFPIHLPEFITKNFSKREHIVVDNFVGTGTTLMACEQLERKCYMMELDPKYCDVIIKRWENFTKLKAKKL